MRCTAGLGFDLFLVSTEWKKRFDKSIQSLKPQALSDHYPLLSDCENLQHGKGHSNLKIIWLKRWRLLGESEHIVKHYQFTGSPSYVLVKKLWALKEDLPKWNWDEFGQIGVRKKTILEVLKELDKEEADALSNKERQRRMS